MKGHFGQISHFATAHLDLSLSESVLVAAYAFLSTTLNAFEGEHPGGLKRILAAGCCASSALNARYPLL